MQSGEGAPRAPRRRAGRAGPRTVITGLTGTITNAGDIDDLGRIGGQFVDASTGATIAFRAIPAGGGRSHRGMEEDDE